MTAEPARDALDQALDQALARVAAAHRADEAAVLRGAPRPRQAPPFDADALHRHAESLALAPLYVARIEELAREYEVLRAPDAARFEASARRYVGAGRAGLDRLATAREAFAAAAADAPPARPDAPLEASPARVLGAVALRLGLSIDVRVVPLASDAAAGTRTLYVRPGPMPRSELVRIAAHELLGHLATSAGAARAESSLPKLGTARAFEAGEGLALVLEADAGALDARRVRRLLGRTDALLARLEGRPLAAARLRALGLDDEDVARTLARARRPSARDAAYLLGHAEVSAALRSGATDRDTQRAGHVAPDAVPLLRAHGALPTPRRWPEASALAAWIDDAA